MMNDLKVLYAPVPDRMGHSEAGVRALLASMPYRYQRLTHPRELETLHACLRCFLALTPCEVGDVWYAQLVVQAGVCRPMCWRQAMGDTPCSQG